MRLFSKNLLMSRASKEYEVLDSLKVNQKCFFILDEFPISATDIEVEIVAHIDKNTAGNTPELFRAGLFADKTYIRVHSRHPMNTYRFFVGDIYWGSPQWEYTGIVNTYKKQKVVVKLNPNGTATMSVLSPEENLLWTIAEETEFISSSSPFYIHGTAESNATFSGLFYSFKITQNGEIIYDIVPAMRTADGEFGLLNKVDGKFYENQGSGILERGEDLA